MSCQIVNLYTFEYWTCEIAHGILPRGYVQTPFIPYCSSTMCRSCGRQRMILSANLFASFSWRRPQFFLDFSTGWASTLSET